MAESQEPNQQDNLTSVIDFDPLLELFTDEDIVNRDETIIDFLVQKVQELSTQGQIIFDINFQSEADEIEIADVADNIPTNLLNLLFKFRHFVEIGLGTEVSFRIDVNTKLGMYTLVGAQKGNYDNVMPYEETDYSHTIHGHTHPDRPTNVFVYDNHIPSPADFAGSIFENRTELVVGTNFATVIIPPHMDDVESHEKWLRDLDIPEDLHRLKNTFKALLIDNLDLLVWGDSSVFINELKTNYGISLVTIARHVSKPTEKDIPQDEGQLKMNEIQELQRLLLTLQSDDLETLIRQTESTKRQDIYLAHPEKYRYTLQSQIQKHPQRYVYLLNYFKL